MYHTLTKEEIYTALDERHSPETQKLLSAGNVAIAGLGGLGSNVAYALARIGVGHLHLIDFDVVDITNVQDRCPEIPASEDQSVSGYPYGLCKSYGR